MMDIERARLILGWSPRLEFSAGMDLMIRDYRAGWSVFSTLL
jgi:nucleoside-diphosphate-sugar epimerase